jgi:hypothetical protein
VTKVKESEQDRVARIGEMLVTQPSSDYVQLTTHLTRLHRAVQQHIAAQLEPALKARMQVLPQNTYEDKKALTKWVNAELRRYGLAIRVETVEKIGENVETKVYPAILASDVGKRREEGRFQLEYMSDVGKKLRPVSTPALSVLMDHFRLMIDDPERRRSGKWIELMGNPPNEKGR